MSDQRSLDPQRTVDHTPAADEPSTVDATGAWRSTSLGRRLPDPPPDAPTIPGYHVAAEIARGGMGRVYAAIDRSLDREVAIKTLLPGADAERFVTESKIAARLPHPGIPPVYAIGVLDDGSPFLVMKLIRGRTLADLLKERSSPKDDLPRFVQIFEQIAQAVGFAHEQGVIHRDLKPHNVMVGEFGEVQVMDWGLAKDLKATPGGETEGSGGFQNLKNTLVGTVMGTPGYMAPEQARGEPADPRADVFALGAILAAILTGKPAFVGSTAMETIEKSANADLADVLTRLGVSDADSELIALARRCLAANRDDRFADGRAAASATAAYRANVERRLRRAETEAANALVREAEQKKRRRILLNSAIVISLALAIGLAISLWQMNRAIAAETQANLDRDAKGTALESEKAARASERQARDRALAALRSMTDEIVENQMARGATLTDENKEFLRKIIEQYEGIATITADDAESRGMRAEGQARVGLMRHRLGELKDAESAYSEAIALYQQLASDFPATLEHRLQIGALQNRMGILLHATGRTQQAESTFFEALELCKRLANEDPARSDIQGKLAVSFINVGAFFHATGRLKQAEEAWNDSLAIHERLAEKFPAKWEYREKLGDAYYNLSLVCRDTGRLDDAGTALEKALAVRRKLRSDFPRRPAFGRQLAQTYKYVGAIAHDRGRLKETEAAFSNAQQIARQLAAEFPAVPEFRELLADCSFHRGGVLREMSRNSEAEAAWKDAEEIQTRLVAEFPARPEFRQQLANTHLSQGGFLFAMNRLEPAEKKLREAVASNRRLVESFPARPDFHEQYARCENQLSGLLLQVGKREEAEASARRALATQKRLADAFPTKPAFRRQLAMSHHHLCSVLFLMGRFEESEAALKETIAIQSRLAADFPTQPELREELGTSHNSMGVMLRERGRLVEGEKAFREAIAILDRLADEFPDRSVYRRLSTLTAFNLSLLLKAVGRWDEARELMAGAVAVRRKLADDFPIQPELKNEAAVALAALVDLCNERRDFRAAKSHLEKSKTWLEAAAAEPKHSEFLAAYRDVLSAAAVTAAGLLEQSAAMDSAKRIYDLQSAPPTDAFIAATALARCVAVVAADGKLDDARRKAAEKIYGDEGMKMLREAVKRGFSDVKRLKEDANLVPLRQREDFKKLVAELETTKTTEKSPKAP